jgi:HEAT repeat protein
LLLGKLDHEAAASRLIELLTFDRAETRVAAAVALRWLAVEATFAPMLAHAQALTEKALQDGHQALPEGRQLVEIFQLFGLRDYRASEPLLRRFIPKQRALYGAARGAAIWAIGRYHENDPSDAPLAASLAERLSDLSPFDPEPTEVRLASAIAIGRMKAASELEALRGFFDATRDDVVSRACRWSIMRITGESLPPPISPGRQYSDWFLKPIDTPAT